MIEEKLKEVLSGLIPLCGAANIEPRIEDIISICKQEIEDAKPKWISVKDKLPKQGQEVIWYHPKIVDDRNGLTKYIRVASYDLPNRPASHWMPLPESPELKEKL